MKEKLFSVLSEKAVLLSVFFMVYDYKRIHPRDPFYIGLWRGSTQTAKMCIHPYPQFHLSVGEQNPSRKGVTSVTEIYGNYAQINGV